MKVLGKVSLSRKAYQKIRHLIISLDLTPGEQVDEASLEKKMGIGRTPIREALQRLASEKLLDLVPGRGFFVSSISIDDIKSLIEAMTALEQTIVFLAAQRIQAGQIKELENLCIRHKKAVLNKDYLQASLLNQNFHNCFCKATNNNFLELAMNGLNHQLERLAYLTYSDDAQPDAGVDYNARSFDDHEALIECFKQHDTDRAVKVIVRHCRLFFLRICHYMEPHVTATTSDLPKYLWNHEKNEKNSLK